jgi:hypothetical protein
MVSHPHDAALLFGHVPLLTAAAQQCNSAVGSSLQGSSLQAGAFGDTMYSQSVIIETSGR